MWPTFDLKGFGYQVPVQFSVYFINLSRRIFQQYCGAAEHHNHAREICFVLYDSLTFYGYEDISFSVACFLSICRCLIFVSAPCVHVNKKRHLYRSGIITTFYEQCFVELMGLSLTDSFASNTLREISFQITNPCCPSHPVMVLTN